MGHTEPGANAIQAAVGPEYEVHTWREREPGAGASIDRFNVVVAIIVSVLFLLVGSIVVNSMMMSVQERVREIGTMLSLGVRRRQVLGIILAEGVFLAFFAAALAALFGVLLVIVLQSKGVTFQIKGASPLIVYPYTTASLIARIVFGCIAGTLLASAYPAYRASRLLPVEALRTL